MIRTCKLSAVGLVLLCLTGCGDSAGTIIHDCLVFWNEVCDYMLLANSNERAKELLETEFNKGDVQRYEPLDGELANMSARLRAEYPAAGHPRDRGLQPPDPHDPARRNTQDRCRFESAVPQ